MTFLSKQIVHDSALGHVSEKISMLRTLIEDNREGLISETKSTAGDKHETSRAMGQLEQEKLNKQLLEAEKQFSLLSGINVEIKAEKVQVGSLIETTMGWFYLSVGLGQIKLEGQTIFCISPQSPIGALLLSTRVGDQINWQNKKIEVLKIF